MLIENKDDDCKTEEIVSESVSFSGEAVVVRGEEDNDWECFAKEVCECDCCSVEEDDDYCGCEDIEDDCGGEEETWSCGNCGHFNIDSNIFCGGCGIGRTEDIKEEWKDIEEEWHCCLCGTDNKINSRGIFCEECKKRVQFLGDKEEIKFGGNWRCDRCGRINSNSETKCQNCQDLDSDKLQSVEYLEAYLGKYGEKLKYSQLSWKCPRCEENNQWDSDECVGCGTYFGEEF